MSGETVRCAAGTSGMAPTPSQTGRKLMLWTGTGTVSSQALCSAPVGWLSSTATAVRFMMSRHCL